MVAIMVFFMEVYYRFLEFLQDLLIPFIMFPLSYQNKFMKKKRKFIGKTKKKNQLDGVRKQLSDTNSYFSLT